MEEFTRAEIQTPINTYVLDYSFTNDVILQTPKAGLSKSYRPQLHKEDVGSISDTLPYTNTMKPPLQSRTL